MSLETVLGGIRDIYSTRYAELASSAIIVFDHFITFGDEVDLVWHSSWSLGKIVFFINRYYALFSVIFNNYGLFSPNLSEQFCRHFFHWQGWTGLVAVMLAESILIMRIYALYFLNKKILALMLVSFVLTATGSAIIMGTVLAKIKVISHIGTLSFCVPRDIPSYFYIFWIPILIQESLLCGLALFRGMHNHGGLFSSKHSLFQILVRDSVFYFLIIFATYLTNILVWTIARPSLLEIPIGMSVAMSATLGNRIILNVRKEKGRLEDGDGTLTTKHGELFITGAADSEIDGPAPLTDIEMLMLRSLRSDEVHDTFLTI